MGELRDINLLGRMNQAVTSKVTLPYRSDWLRPTEASVIDIHGNVLGHCARSIYYRIKGEGVTNPMSLKALKRAELGNYVEEAIRNRIRDTGLYVGSNMRYRNQEYNISGEMDCLVKHGTDYIAVEVKSFWGYNAEREIMGGWRGRGNGRYFEPGKPKDNHLLQLLVYISSFNETRAEENNGFFLTGGKLIYSSRDTQDDKEFDVEIVEGANGVHHAKVSCLCEDGNYHRVLRDDFTIEGLYERYVFIQGKINRNEIPNREFRRFLTNAEITTAAESGEISKTTYAEWQRSPNELNTEKCGGSWQCCYCDFKQICTPWAARQN